MSMPEFKARCGDHATQLAAFELLFDLFAPVFGNGTMMRHGDRVGVRMRGDQHGGGSDHGIVVFGEASRPSGEPRSGYGWVESLAVDSGWDALSDTLKAVRPSLRSNSASRPASALTAVSDPVFRDVRNCAYRSLSRAVSFFRKAT